MILEETRSNTAIMIPIINYWSIKPGNMKQMEICFDIADMILMSNWSGIGYILMMKPEDAL